MAELRRVGGEMESHRTPGGRRSVLLPSEVQLCEALGITADDYWTFVDLLHESKERGKEYEHIPDVVATGLEPATIIAIASLVIGVASTALSLLLRPSVPGQSKAPGSIRTPDLNGRDKYLPTAGFDSLQNLANLGDIIPLIYCQVRFSQNQYVGGGARVNSTLLWSHMLSKGRYQELRALLLFGHGRTGFLEGSAPTFASYAIGESLLNNYNKGKIELFYVQDGGRIDKTQNRYSESLMPTLPGSQQPFEVVDFNGESVPSFSGARTPATQAQFGLYSPLPNGMKYKVPYEVTLVYDDASDDSQDEVRAKARKIAADFPRYCFVEAINGVSDPGPAVVQVGDIITYVIGTNKYDGDTFRSNGAQDVIQAQDRTRFAADAALSVGDTYLIGDALCVCYQKDNSPWYPESPNPVRAYFRVVESGGRVMCSTADNADSPGDRTTVQRVAYGSITNNRQCDRTDILIKSIVYKRINGFANVNSRVDDDVIQDFQQDGTQFSLGSMQLFNKRISLFNIGMRRAGTTDEFYRLRGYPEDFPALFVVLGRTPEPQYNTVSIKHPNGQYEFQMFPVSGSSVTVATNQFVGTSAFPAYILDAVSNNNSTYEFGANTLPNGDEAIVQITGHKISLDSFTASNLEWILGQPPQVSQSGEVIRFSQTESLNNNGELPNLNTSYKNAEERLDVDTQTGSFVDATPGLDNQFYWDGFVGSSSGDELIQGNIRYRIGTLFVPGSFILRSIIRDELSFDDPPDHQLVVIPTTVTGTGTGLELFTFQWDDGGAHWSIKEPGTGYQDGDTIFIDFQFANDVNVQVFVNKDVSQDNLRVNDAIQDYVVYDAEDTSALQQPEHEIVNLNEIVDSSSPSGPQYEDLAHAGLRLASGKEWSTFSQVSAFFREGIVGTRADGTFGTISTVPDIALDLLTNKQYGAGAFVPSEQVDTDSMADARRFCTANNFYWDGVIAERLNIREWIFEQSAFCMLSFIIKGGKFSLYPDVPFLGNGEIDYGKDIRPEIKTLFTDGNIRNLQTSFLSPEERQPFKAVCIWRRDELDGFPDKQVLVVKLKGTAGGSDDDPEETFDMSQFCTSQQHAEKFAKYAIKTRTLVDHGVRFETTPQSALTLEPGDYFDLVTTVSHPTNGSDSGDRLRNGSIDGEGYINGVELENGSLNIVYWKPGTQELETTTISVTNGKTNNSVVWGSVFTKNLQSDPIRRTYKAESITYGEDGMIEVAGSYVPKTSSGALAVLDWDNQFDLATG